MTRPVTVIIPTFNRSRLLGDTIMSILSQEEQPERILVVDDGSTDETRDIVRHFGASIDYVWKENAGKSSALNAALALVRSEFVWIFDDDDLALPQALSILLGLLEARPDCGFAYGRYEIFQRRLGRERVWSSETLLFPDVDDDQLLAAQLRRSFIHQPGLLVRRECYAVVGGFDESMLRSQDYEMMLRLTRRFKGVGTTQPIFRQRRHGGLRGTAARRVRARHVRNAWKSYDRRILSDVYGSYSLGEFLGRSYASRELDEASTITALLTRASVMGRRGLWREALRDIGAAAPLLARSRTSNLAPANADLLSSLLDRDSVGLEDFLEQHDGFRKMLRDCSPEIALHLRVAIMQPLRARMIRSLLTLKWSRLLRLCSAFFVVLENKDGFGLSNTLLVFRFSVTGKVFRDHKNSGLRQAPP